MRLVLYLGRAKGINYAKIGIRNIMVQFKKSTATYHYFDPNCRY